MIFDLDPGPRVAWEDVVRGARLLRERLGDLGLDSFVKTTGGKGLHVVVPLLRRWGWEEVKAFSGALALRLVREEPEHFTATMSKSQRRGKIFIDYFRNSRGATSVAPYSTRARHGAPVATPLGWEELSADIAPDHFTVANLGDHLLGRPRDPWAGFFDRRQSFSKKALQELQQPLP